MFRLVFLVFLIFTVCGFIIDNSLQASAARITEPILRGDAKAIQKLVRENKEAVNEVDKSGLTPLMLAVRERHIGIAKCLMKSGANVNSQDALWGNSALIIAAQQGQLEMVKALLQAGADIKAKNRYGHTALMLASQLRHEEVVVMLTSRARSCSTIQTVASRGTVEDLKALLQAGVSANTVSPAGITPLMMAANAGEKEAVLLLLQWGADINAADMYGFTPLIFAVQEGYVEVARVLIRAGANVNAQDNLKNSALIVAAQQGCGKLVEILLRAKADKNIVNKYGFTPLALAEELKHHDVVSLLNNTE